MLLNRDGETIQKILIWCMHGWSDRAVKIRVDCAENLSVLTWPWVIGVPPIPVAPTPGSGRFGWGCSEKGKEEPMAVGNCPVLDSSLAGDFWESVGRAWETEAPGA